MAISADWWDAALLVRAAAILYIIGFLFRDQLKSRGVILAGTVLYVLYYYLEPDVPLWDAIVCSVLMGLANAYTMMRIAADRRPAHFSGDDQKVYRALHGIAPSDFRRIMARTEKSTVATDTTLTVEGEVPDYLYIVISGEIVLEKRGTVRALDAPIFIGEIAYLLRTPASGTVTLRAGGCYARWSTEELRGLSARHDGLRDALETAISRDLAAKVSAS